MASSRLLGSLLVPLQPGSPQPPRGEHRFEVIKRTMKAGQIGRAEQARNAAVLHRCPPGEFPGDRAPVPGWPQHPPLAVAGIAGSRHQTRTLQMFSEPPGVHGVGVHPLGQLPQLAAGPFGHRPQQGGLRRVHPQIADNGLPVIPEHPVHPAQPELQPRFKQPACQCPTRCPPWSGPHGGSTTCPDPLERRTGRWAGDHSHTGMTLNPPRDQSLQDPRGDPPRRCPGWAKVPPAGPNGSTRSAAPQVSLAL